MRPRPFLFFFFLLLIPFSVYFVRPDLIASDPYGFLRLVCTQNNAVGVSGAPFLLFSLLPCNVLALKVVLFLLAFVSGCFIIKLAMLFKPDSGWRACYLIFLSSVLVLDFARLENDAFAYPLLFASVYFFFHSMRVLKSSRRSFFTSIALLVAAGLLWQGAVFYIIAYTLNIWLFALVSVPVVFFYRSNIVSAILRTAVIVEDLPFKFHYHWILNMGLFGVFFDTLLLPQALFFFALGTASAKFWVLSLPFLTVGAVIAIDKWQELFQVWLKRFNLDLHEAFAIISIITMLAVCQSVWLNEPRQEHWQAIDFALEQGQGEINNDFGMGYWVLWRGGSTESYQSPARQKEFGGGQVVVTELETGCQPLKTFKKVYVVKC